MFTEEEYLSILEALSLELGYMNDIKNAINNIKLLISETLVRERVTSYVDRIQELKESREALLSRNQGRLKKASSLEWDTSIGSVTMDADKILDEVIRDFYNFLNLSSGDIPLKQYSVIQGDVGGLCTKKLMRN